MKEDARTGQRSYACHAYLTFVARAPPPPPPLLPLTFSSLPLPLSLLPTRTSSSPTKKKSQPPFQVPAVQPRTVLEHKRYLLAGRRRGHRFQRRAIWDAHLSLFRSYVLAFPADPYDDNLAGEGGAGVKTLKDVEIELVAEGYVKGDQDIRVEGDMVVAEVEGFMDKVSFPLKDVRRLLSPSRSPSPLTETLCGLLRRRSKSSSPRAAPVPSGGSPSPGPTRPLRTRTPPGPAAGASRSAEAWGGRTTRSWRWTRRSLRASRSSGRSIVIRRGSCSVAN